MSDEKVVRAAPIRVTSERRDLQGMLEMDDDTLDPDFNYRFVRDDKMNIARKKLRGYRFVTKEDEEKPLVDADDHADGLIRVGDTILMKCPKRNFEARQEAAREFSEGRLRGVKKRVKGLAKKHGVKTIDNKED